MNRIQLRTMLALISVVTGMTGCKSPGLPHGIAMENLQARYEKLGQLYAIAAPCGVGIPVRSDLETQLKAYAGLQGADEAEQTSLISYFGAAVENEHSASSCTADDRTRNTALFNEKLAELK